MKKRHKWLTITKICVKHVKNWEHKWRRLRVRVLAMHIHYTVDSSNHKAHLLIQFPTVNLNLKGLSHLKEKGRALDKEFWVNLKSLSTIGKKSRKVMKCKSLIQILNPWISTNRFRSWKNHNQCQKSSIIISRVQFYSIQLWMNH